MQKPTVILLNKTNESESIFKLVRMARIALETSRKKDKAKKMVKEVFACETYDDALTTIKKYVDFLYLDSK